MIRYLSWDSEHFGIKVGRVDASVISFEEYSQICAAAKSQHYDLIYVVGPRFEADLCTDKFLLVDEKVIYEAHINELEKEKDEVVELPVGTDYHELLDLAYESGKYSRYKIDENLPPHVFGTLYSKWIENAVNRENGQRVLVVQRNHHYVGMLTFQPTDDHRYTIGLIAVSPESAGQGIGTSLLHALFRLVGKGACIEVATQLRNQAACHYYEKNGFTVSSITPFYHLWIK